MDLLWIEGSSSAWQYPEEIEELKEFIRERKPAIRKKPSAISSSTIVNAGYQPMAPTVTATTAMLMQTGEQLAVSNNYPYEDVARDLYAEASFSRQHRRVSLNGNIMGLLLIVIGAAMAAFIVKNIVGSFSNAPEAPISEARLIQTETLTSENNSAAMRPIVAQANMAVSPVTTAPLVPAATPVTEVKPVAEQPVKEVDAKPATVIAEHKTNKTVTTEALKSAEVNSPVVAAKADADTKTEVKQDPPKEKKVGKDVRSMVHLAANDYKVGVLGGISNLELQVTNDSPNEVDNATVEVNYLKPNGAVVHTETLQVRDIQPGKSKKVQVPGSSRGVKVAYRIIDASSHDS